MENCNTIVPIPQNNGMYSVITTWIKYGQHIQQVDKQYVRKVCECEKGRYEFERKHYANTRNVHMQIEVVNNKTGEIREFWNSQENKINF